MTYLDLTNLIGNLTNDPNHDRYTVTDIPIELDNTMDDWNITAKILKGTTTVTILNGTRQYALSGLTGTPISFPRVTHKGVPLDKRSKQWLDLYSGTDWTVETGSPREFVIEGTDPTVPYITLHPTPTGNDAGANLVVEYIKKHTTMVASSDTPFMSGTTVNYLLRPYDWGVGYDTAARLLLRDPSPINSQKAANYAGIARNVLNEVIQVFKALEAEEPKRISGGRYWTSGTQWRTH